MKIDTLTGLATDAVQRSSPNHDPRPDGALPELIVVHNISLPPGEFGGDHIDALFLNGLDPGAHPYFAAIAGLEVSAHFLIRRDGALLQYVSLHQRAWHAGRSCFAGRERCNDFSIGIELEGTDTTPYTEPQYERLAGLIVALLDAYPTLSRQRIVGHCDIAPERKTDPGPAFDWARLHRDLDTQLWPWHTAEDIKTQENSS
ncbi:MAG: 1,6-anhydro-N-acetylmuramyl-L-alanine amidase AmpD [Thiotrichales bacterium]